MSSACKYSICGANELILRGAAGVFGDGGGPGAVLDHVMVRGDAGTPRAASLWAPARVPLADGSSVEASDHYGVRAVVGVRAPAAAPPAAATAPRAAAESARGRPIVGGAVRAEFASACDAERVRRHGGRFAPTHSGACGGAMSWLTGGCCVDKTSYLGEACSTAAPRDDKWSTEQFPLGYDEGRRCSTRVSAPCGVTHFGGRCGGYGEPPCCALRCVADGAPGNAGRCAAADRVKPGAKCGPGTYSADGTHARGCRFCGGGAVARGHGATRCYRCDRYADAAGSGSGCTGWWAYYVRGCRKHPSWDHTRCMASDWDRNGFAPKKEGASEGADSSSRSSAAAVCSFLGAATAAVVVAVVRRRQQQPPAGEACDHYAPLHSTAANDGKAPTVDV